MVCLLAISMDMVFVLPTPTISFTVDLTSSVFHLKIDLEC